MFSSLRKLVTVATAASFLGSGFFAAPAASEDADAVPVDIVLAISTTGSMGPYLETAREVAETAAEEILGENPEARVGLLEYRDAGEAFVARPVVPLSNDFSDLTEGLDGLAADGGGDVPEAVFTGIYLSATEFDFRASANRSIVVIGDAAAHNPDQQTGLTDVDIINLFTGESIEMTQQQLTGAELALGTPAGSTSVVVNPETEESAEQGDIDVPASPTERPTSTEPDSSENPTAAPTTSSPPTTTPSPTVPQQTQRPSRPNRPNTGTTTAPRRNPVTPQAPATQSEWTPPAEEVPSPLVTQEVEQPPAETTTVDLTNPMSLYAVTPDVALASDMTPLAEATGGKIFNVESVDELGEGLEEAMSHTASAPYASISAMSAVFTGVPVPVSAATTAGGTGELAYEFSVTDVDGEVVAQADSADEVLSVTFETAGHYEATVIVADEEGRTSTASTDVLVLELPASLEDAKNFEVTADATVAAGSHLGVEVDHADPIAFFLFVDEAAFLAGRSAATGDLLGDWETEGVVIPGEVAAGSYLFAVAAQDGTLGHTTIEVTAPADQGPADMQDTENTAGFDLASTGLQNAALLGGGLLMFILGVIAVRVGTSGKPVGRRK